MTKKLLSLLALFLLAISMSGCSSTSDKDPLEPMNRGIYKFNDVADKAVLKPVASGYKAITPTPVRAGINNFFNNLSNLVTIVNQLLQFKFGNAAETTGRVVVNTTVGILGFIDVASRTGFNAYREDFGQTLGYWGMGSGPYLMLPLLGPSNLRDTAGLLTDWFFFEPIGYVENPRTRNILLGVKFIDKRADLLPGSDLLDEAALDPYAFMRDAYSQRRVNQISDGQVSEQIDDSFEDVDSATEVK
jgi:phospholipid-binding lipoprotein MlaA